MLKEMLLEEREFSSEELKNLMASEGYELMENHNNKLVFGQLFDDDIITIDYKLNNNLIYIIKVL